VRIYDVSLTISPRLVTWPGDPKITLTRASSIAQGAVANVSRLDAGVHTGTHVDAPLHFIDGAQAVEAMPLDKLIGPCLVVEADPPSVELRPEDLPSTKHSRILFKTRNSRRWLDPHAEFDKQFVAVGLSLAERLVAEQKVLVGVDYLSVEPYGGPAAHPVHVTLLRAGMVVVEGLNLGEVEAGEYELVCLPMKLAGSDGAPARTVLIQRA
jgi:arylformamidase